LDIKQYIPNNLKAKQKISREILKYLDMNENNSTTHKIYGIVTAVFIGKFIAVNT